MNMMKRRMEMFWVAALIWLSSTQGFVPLQTSKSSFHHGLVNPSASSWALLQQQQSQGESNHWLDSYPRRGLLRNPLSRHRRGQVRKSTTTMTTVGKPSHQRRWKSLFSKMVHFYQNRLVAVRQSTSLAAAAFLFLPKFTSAVTNSNPVTAPSMSMALLAERLGKSVFILAMGYALARWKRQLLVKWTDTQLAMQQAGDDTQDDPHHLYFYNLLGNGFIGAGMIVMILKVFHMQQGAGAGLQSVFAAGGLGAVVFGIASRNVAEQVVGGLVIAATNAYDEGDRVRLPESNLEGTVKRISLVETDIEGYDYSVVQIPNSRILNQHVVNLSRVKKQRVLQTIRLRYSDLPKVTELVERIPSQIATQASPIVITDDANRPIRAFLSCFREDHVEMVVMCHLHCRPGSAAFLHWRQQVLLAIAQAVQDVGAEFSLPTSVLEPPSTNSALGRSLPPYQPTEAWYTSPTFDEQVEEREQEQRQELLHTNDQNKRSNGYSANPGNYTMMGNFTNSN